MLPDTELLCDLESGQALCNAGAWHGVFLIQTVLLLVLGLANVLAGMRHRWVGLAYAVEVQRRFALATAFAGVLPIATGLVLREQVKRASLDCYLHHATNGCHHSLLDRGTEMQAVLVWSSWTAGVVLATALVGVLLLASPGRKGPAPEGF